MQSSPGPAAGPLSLNGGNDSARVEREVRWGPFPLRGWRLVSGLGLSAIGILCCVFGLLRSTLSCARTGALAGQCELSRSGFDAPRRFPIESLRELKVAYSETRNKGRVTRHGRILIPVLPGGRAIALQSEGRDAADRNAAALRTFAGDPAAQQIAIATERPYAMLIIGGLMALMGVSFLYSVIAGRRRFLFQWDALTRQLEVRLVWPLGLGSGAPKTVSIDSPQDVEICWERVEDFWTSSRSPGPPGGWLRIRAAGGRTLDLSLTALGLGKGRAQPGYRVHLRAAEALRRLLRCPPRSAEEDARVTASYEKAKPQAAPGFQGAGGKAAVVWLGACCGSLVGLAVSGSLAVGLGFKKLSDDAGGLWFFLGILLGAAAGIAVAWRLTQVPDER